MEKRHWLFLGITMKLTEIVPWGRTLLILSDLVEKLVTRNIAIH
jgi:hypothetical protein